jgi:hypothetical protein
MSTRSNFLVIVNLFSFLVIYAKEIKKYPSFDTKTKKHTTQTHKEKLFENVGCKHSNVMEIDANLELVPPYQTEYFKNNASMVLEMSEKYKKDVEEGTLAPMYLEFISPVVGYGIKASKKIKEGDFIGVYAGRLRNLRWNDPEFKEDVDYAWYYTVLDKNDQHMVIDGKYQGNELRFINHASNPNTKRIDVIVGNKFYVCYVAVKDIAKDEELTVSYGDGYWNSRGVVPEDVN